MNYEIKEGVLIISPHGNLLSDQNREVVADLIKKNIEAGVKRVLFNLHEVNFMNSTGLDLLISSLSRTRKLGGELALCEVPEQTRKLLLLTKLTSVFMIFTQQENAIAYLNSI